MFEEAGLFSRDRLTTSAVALAALAFVVIAGAWAFEWAGHPPCELCVTQRYAYYLGVPLALAAAALAAARAPGFALAALGVFALAFLANAGIAIYHSGIEAKFWEGPTACTGAMAPGQGDLLQQLQSVKVVRCDDVGLRVFGLTLANYNIVISAALAALAAATIARGGRRSAPV